jgi:hypothetical protein
MPAVSSFLLNLPAMLPAALSSGRRVLGVFWPDHMQLPSTCHPPRSVFPIPTTPFVLDGAQGRLLHPHFGNPSGTSIVFENGSDGDAHEVALGSDSDGDGDVFFGKGGKGTGTGAHAASVNPAQEETGTGVQQPAKATRNVRKAMECKLEDLEELRGEPKAEELTDDSDGTAERGQG